MPKLGMEPLRRAEAINAALECICECGIDGLTLDKVADKAGFSKGIAAYYFKSKKQLIIESLKAMLLAYGKKIQSEIKDDMQPIEMLEKVVDISLPEINNEMDDRLNVLDVEGSDKINLPEIKVAKIFVCFFVKAVNDEDIRNIIIEACTGDVEGISQIMLYAKIFYGLKDVDEKRAAYTLLALVYGLSFFRVAGLMLPGESDNKAVAYEWINTFINRKSQPL